MEPMLISAMDKPLQPWRNGGGFTRQLLAWPDDENWLLRISMANVSQDGPFSAWPRDSRRGRGEANVCRFDHQPATSRSRLNFPWRSYA